MDLYPEPQNELQRWGIQFEYYYDYYTDPNVIDIHRPTYLQLCKYLQDGALLIFKHINTPIGKGPLAIQLWARTFEYYFDFYSLPETERHMTIDQLLYSLQEGARLVLEYYCNEPKSSAVPSPEDEVRPSQDREPRTETPRIC